MKIAYKTERMQESVECLLLGINYDSEVLMLAPSDFEAIYEDKDFPASLKHCELPMPKPRLLKS